MPKLPTVKAKEVFTVLAKLGFTEGKTKGSHVHFKHSDGRRTTIALHGNKEIPKGTLLAIIKDLEISKDDFVKALKKK